MKSITSRSLLRPFGWCVVLLLISTQSWGQECISGNCVNGQGTNTYADGDKAAVEEDPTENKWGLEETNTDSIIISVNGNITFGDRYRIIFFPNSKDKCNQPQSYISSYTVVGNAEEKFENIPSEYLLSEINEEEKFLIRIDHVSDFMLGKRAWMHVGINTVEELVDFHKDNEEIKIEFLSFYDREEQKILPNKIADYFDISKNTWSLDGFEEALNKGKAACLMAIKNG